MLTFLEIGSGWFPTILSNQAELEFVRENQRKLSNNQSYWIHGTTVYVSTQQNETNDNEHFQLRSGSETLLLPGVLCENGMYQLIINKDFALHHHQNG